jgi:hypothetical protein
MKLRLLAPHMVPVNSGAGDRWCPAGAVLDPAPPGYLPTPLMEGLDPEGVAALKSARDSV